jgi:hypothetical protein
MPLRLNGGVNAYIARNKVEETPDALVEMRKGRTAKERHEQYENSLSAGSIECVKHVHQSRVEPLVPRFQPGDAGPGAISR